MTAVRDHDFDHVACAQQRSGDWISRTMQSRIASAALSTRLATARFRPPRRPGAWKIGRKMRVHLHAVKATVEHREGAPDNPIDVRRSDLRGREARQGGELVD